MDESSDRSEREQTRVKESGSNADVGECVSCTDGKGMKGVDE